MSRQTLIEMARRNIEISKTGNYDLAESVVAIPAKNYVDRQRWDTEMSQIFKRVPLMVACSAEVPKPGDYKAMDVVGTPVLITRGADGAIRAFVNSCSHRGAVVVAEGTGNARRFSCPYHAWTYDQTGSLIGVLDRDLFGDFDVSCHGLTPLWARERAGLIFAIVDPYVAAPLDLDTFLCGYDEMLADLNLAECRLVGQQHVDGPNWKVAYDGYLDFYHLPILHKDTFGTDISNKAVYDAWGPHQRVTSPGRHGGESLTALPESEWPMDRLTLGVWTIFPHISIASFDSGGRVFMISQLFPGETPGSSTTVQTFLHTQPDSDGLSEQIEGTMKFLHHVVQDEDYYTGLRLQKALKTGAKHHVLFGRNEAGGQRFHRWVDTLIATANDDLASVFAADIPG